MLKKKGRVNEVKILKSNSDYS